MTVTRVRAYLGVHPDKPKAQGPQYFESTSVVEISGALDEPVRRARKAEIAIYPPRDDERPGTEKWSGYVRCAPDVVSAVAWLPTREFDRLWTLATSGRLAHAEITLTTPRYRDADLTYLAFATHADEDDAGVALRPSGTDGEALG